jgi:hypothetical protein
VRITKRQLRRIIKEEKQKLLSEQDHEIYAKDDDLRKLGDTLSEMVAVSTQMEALMNDMGYRYGELTALGTSARMVQKSVKELAAKYASKLDDLSKSHEKGWYDK